MAQVTSVGTLPVSFHSKNWTKFNKFLFTFHPIDNWKSQKFKRWCTDSAIGRIPWKRRPNWSRNSSKSSSSNSSIRCLKWQQGSNPRESASGSFSFFSGIANQTPKYPFLHLSPPINWKFQTQSSQIKTVLHLPASDRFQEILRISGRSGERGWRNVWIRCGQQETAGGSQFPPPNRSFRLFVQRGRSIPSVSARRRRSEGAARADRADDILHGRPAISRIQQSIFHFYIYLISSDSVDLIWL